MTLKSISGRNGGQDPQDNALAFKTLVVRTIKDLREVTAEQALDPLALLLRLVAYGFGLRTAFLGVRLVRRVRLSWQMRRYALWLGDEGLLLRTLDLRFSMFSFNLGQE